ncbi:unnamed protein product [Owenia fusiformis]|uniref:Uncharacterized protein n=1 Tax=Owenia fusiformis TaxID=6347 RepID=A0A8J1TC01_OWEFU|nr:unnamed protein product [Owenia fusiformis]
MNINSATVGEGDRPSREATIAAQLSRPQARAILDMGYDKKMVSYIIKKRLERNEPDFPNATEMLEAIFDVEEKINSGELNLDDPDPEPQDGATGGPVEGATGGAATPGPSRVTPASKGAKEGKGPSGRLEIPSQATLASGKAPEPVTVDRTEPMDMGEETHGGNTEGDDKDKDDKDKDKDDDEEDVESLKAKVRESNEEKLCKICLERERRLVFLPCGHACSCAICAPGLRTCPMCREIIRGTVRIYFS